MTDASTDRPRKRGRPKGTPASAAQKATGPENAKKSVAARKKRKQEREAALEVPRWKQLEDGTLTVKDMTDEELIRGECANNDGTWEGRRHVLAPRIQQRMKTEYKRRFAQGLEKLGPLVLEAFEDILDDDEARAQQVAVGKLITEYTIGKVPEVVHVGAETEYDRLQQGAFVIMRGEENVEVLDEDIVEGEWKEEPA